MFQFIAVLGQKTGIVLVTGISLIQFVQRVNQCFGNENAAVRTEMAMFIRLTVSGCFKQRIRSAATVFLFHENLSCNANGTAICTKRTDYRLSCSDPFIRLSDSLDECMDFPGILDAACRFDTTADVNGKRAQLRNRTSDILRAQATTQNDPRPDFF